MTNEEIIRMAREADLEFVTDAIEFFATLAYEAGRAAENEACANWCEAAMTDELEDEAYYLCKNLAATIRARREQ